MKAKILEFNIGRFPQMNVQCVLGCMKKIQILRNGYDVQINEDCKVRSHAECLEMCEDAYVCVICETLLLWTSKRKLVKRKLITAITVAIYIMLYMLYIYFVFVIHYTNKVKCMIFKMLNAWANKTILTKLPWHFKEV